MPAEAASRPWRRSLRFSVRGLIVLVLVIGLWLGWLVRSARRQREAIAAIRNVRGQVRYDWQWKNGRAIPRAKPWAPKWLVDGLGADYVGHVTMVSMPGVFDDELVAIGRLSQLRDLYIAPSSAVTDRGLAHLKDLHNLVQLDLRGSQISDAGLAHLKRLIRY
jgi:hypothetical protein